MGRPFFFNNMRETIVYHLLFSRGHGESMREGCVIRETRWATTAAWAAVKWGKMGRVSGITPTLQNYLPSWILACVRSKDEKAESKQRHMWSASCGLFPRLFQQRRSPSITVTETSGSMFAGSLNICRSTASGYT